jgi:hypothetical protein
MEEDLYRFTIMNRRKMKKQNQDKNTSNPQSKIMINETLEEKNKRL